MIDEYARLYKELIIESDKDNESEVCERLREKLDDCWRKMTIAERTEVHSSTRFLS